MVLVKCRGVGAVKGLPVPSVSFTGTFALVSRHVSVMLEKSEFSNNCPQEGCVGGCNRRGEREWKHNRVQKQFHTIFLYLYSHIKKMFSISFIWA